MFDLVHRQEMEVKLGEKNVLDVEIGIGNVSCMKQFGKCTLMKYFEPCFNITKFINDTKVMSGEMLAKRQKSYPEYEDS